MRTSFGQNTVLTYPLTGSDVAVQLGDLILASNMQYQRSERTAFGLPVTGTPVSAVAYLFTADNPGRLLGFHASVTVPGSAASVTVDLFKNGVSVTGSTPVTLTNSSSARTTYNATVTTIPFVAGDEFTAVLVEGSNTGMQGVKCWVNAVENGQPL